MNQGAACCSMRIAFYSTAQRGYNVMSMMSTLYVLLSCVAVCLAQQVVDHPVVQTTSGPIQGETIEYPAGRLSRYLGVPFARPPLGSLRFTPPQTPEPWTETLTTTAYGNRCYQSTFLDDIISFGLDRPEISEDCLYLNVHVPLANTDQKRAVMVWIHGGGLVLGSASDYPMEGLTLAGDVITVSINYRVDVFGFIATEDDRTPGNIGFLDQVLALHWVQDNIAAFGGDPSKVTIFGESAGSWSVNALMVSPLARGLFTRAISQSGSFYGIILETREERAERTRDLAASMECTASPEADMLTCLQNTPADKLLQKSLESQFMMGSIAGAITGEEFFPQQPGELWDQHHIAPGVDYMLGTNSDEALLMLWFSPVENATQRLLDGVEPDDPLFDALLNSMLFLAKRHAHMSDKLKECVMDQYLTDLGDKFGVMRGLLDAFADRIFLAPTLGSAARMAETDQKVYMYRFDHRITSELPENVTFPRPPGAPELELGADHGHDIFFMLALTFVEGVPLSWVAKSSKEDKAISRSMVHAWTTFAKTGKMTVLLEDGSEMDWPEYDKTSEKYLELKYPMTSSSVKSRLRPSADSFWNVLIPALLETEKKPENTEPKSEKDEL